VVERATVVVSVVAVVAVMVVESCNG